MRALVVSYSRTGTTKKIAESVVAAIDGELEEIIDRTKRSGLLGYLRSGYEAARSRVIPIGPAVRDPSTYDVVIVGTPIWNLSVSSPVRSYLHRHRGAFRNVAFFCTCGGRGGERAFAQMTEICGVTPVATLVVRDAEVARSERAVARFVADIDRALSTMARSTAPSSGGQRTAPAEDVRNPSH